MCSRMMKTESNITRWPTYAFGFFFHYYSAVKYYFFLLSANSSCSRLYFWTFETPAPTEQNVLSFAVMSRAFCTRKQVYKFSAGRLASNHPLRFLVKICFLVCVSTSSFINFLCATFSLFIARGNRKHRRGEK